MCVTPGKVADLRAITACGVMRTPGAVIDAKVVQPGGIASRDRIEARPAAGTPDT